MDKKNIESFFAEYLSTLGEDALRPGLLDTPKRVRESFEYLTSGYKENLSEILEGSVFEEPYSEMVLVKKIEFYSLCEHHLLPFFGHVHVAYIPNKKIIGLSKIPRIINHFARRLQVQERMTDQIAQAVSDAINPYGVGCIVEASHLCMMMRGVQVQSSLVVTNSMRGVFLSEPKTRMEFLSIVGIK